jgi:hypothetical protein
LLATGAADIPEDDTAIVTTTGQDARIMGMPFNLSDDVLVSLHAVDFAVLGESHVEDSHRAIGRASSEKHIVLLVECECVDGIGVTFDSDGRFRVRSSTQIHQAESLIVCNCSEKVLSVHGMPLDVVDCSAVMVEDACGGQDFVGFGEVVDVPVRVSQMGSWHSKKARVIPNTDSLVLTTSRQLTFEVGVPVETEALLLVTLQLNLGVNLIGLWHG